MAMSSVIAPCNGILLSLLAAPTIIIEMAIKFPMQQL